MTYEVVKKEIRNGAVQKEYNLFDTKRQVTKYLRDVAQAENKANSTVGSIKDGNIKVFDTDGVMRREYNLNNF